MYSTSPSASSSSSTEVLTSTDRPGPRINSLALDRINRWVPTLRELKCDPMESLVAAHEYLSGGSTKGYEDLLRQAARADHVKTHSGAQFTQPPTSWPEFVLTLQARGIPARITVGALPEFFYDRKHQNRLSKGHELLHPTQLTLASLGEPTRGGNWKEQLFLHVIDPAIDALKPGQTLVLAPPNARALLLGKDDQGVKFGVSTERWDLGLAEDRDFILRDKALDEVVGRARDSSSPTSPWAMLTLASDRHP